VVRDRKKENKGLKALASRGCLGHGTATRSPSLHISNNFPIIIDIVTDYLVSWTLFHACPVWQCLLPNTSLDDPLATTRLVNRPSRITMAPILLRHLWGPLRGPLVACLRPALPK